MLLFKKIAMYGGILILVLIAIATAFGLNFVSKLNLLGANMTCNTVFVSEIPTEWVIEHEINNNPASDFFNVTIDETEQTVSLSLKGLAKQTSKFNPGYGCSKNGSVASQLEPFKPQSAQVETPFPNQTGNFEELNAFISAEFDTHSFPAESAVNHRALIVLKEGHVIAEHYAEPYGANNRQNSMSIAKSILSFLWAVADYQGLADLDAPATVPEWSANDDRSAITNRDLLNMVSGIDFEEKFSLNSTLAKMMLAQDKAAYSASLPKIEEPGAIWNYASSDTNIASRSLALELEVSGLSLNEFAHDNLFSVIGANGFELVRDESGTFVASSWAWGRPMDFARIGQLMIQDGVWDGRRLVSESWISDVKTSPVEASSGKYSLGFWLNLSEQFGGNREHEGFPEETIAMEGISGQRVYVIPSEEIVIVRLGNTTEGGFGPLKEFLQQVYVLANRADLDPSILLESVTD